MKKCAAVLILALALCSSPAIAQWTFDNTKQAQGESPWTPQRAVEEANKNRRMTGTPANPPSQRIEKRTVFREDPRMDQRVRPAAPLDDRIVIEEPEDEALPVYEETPE